MWVAELVRDWRRLLRYYLTGAVNTAFGYGLFAAFVWAGRNIFVAQLVSHCLGVAFNFITFSRFAFADRIGSRARFLLSYAANYGLSLVTLLALSGYVNSAYLAGFITVIFVSALNYLVLGRLVFNRQTEV